MYGLASTRSVFGDAGEGEVSVDRIAGGSRPLGSLWGRRLSCPRLGVSYAPAALGTRLNRLKPHGIYA